MGGDGAVKAARLKFAKNAAANVVNGLVAAILSIVLPHFFVHDFTRPVFSLWILILQLGTFVNVLNFGLSVAIGRHVAVAVAKDDLVGAQQMVAAGVQILCGLAGIGFLLILALDVAMPVLFHQISAPLMPVAQKSLLWVGGALAVGLPFSGFSGAMIGLQRNEVPALTNVVGKGALGVVLAVVAARTHDLLAVAQAFFWVSLFGYLLQYAAFKVLAGWRLPVSRLAAARRELAYYCVSLSVWSVAMLLVSGVDTSIVGAFDYRAVAAYGLAANLSVFFAGSVNVMMNPLVQVFAGFFARGDTGAAMRLLDVSSFLASLALMLAGLWLVGLEHFGFSLWVGPGLAAQAFPFFCLLVASNTVRNTGTPYAMYLLGSGQQNRVMLTPLIEGLTNFLCSVAGAWLFGAIGVAVGALVGSCVGIAANFVYNMRRTLPAGFSPLRYFRDNLVVPAVLAAPCLAVLVYFGPREALDVTVAGLMAASALVLWPAWKRCAPRAANWSMLK